MKIDKYNVAYYIGENAVKLVDSAVKSKNNTAAKILEHISKNRVLYDISVLSDKVVDMSFEMDLSQLSNRMLKDLPYVTGCLIYKSFNILYSTLDDNKIYVSGLQGAKSAARFVFEFTIDKSSMNISLTNNYNVDATAIEVSKIILFVLMSKDIRKISISQGKTFDIGYKLKNNTKYPISITMVGDTVKDVSNIMKPVNINVADIEHIRLGLPNLNPHTEFQMGDS